MKASEFVQTYAKRGAGAWEAAAVDMFRKEQVPSNPWVPIALSARTKDGRTVSAVLQVSADYLTIGEGDDTLRLPLTPKRAQEIVNLDGSLLPTPWLEYQRWRQGFRIPRDGMVPNKGADLAQYAAHDAKVRTHLQGWDRTKPLSGAGKTVVVSNIYQPGKVLIHGWYRPEPDVFNDGRAWNDPSPEKQPQQAVSNLHGEDYVDYSHKIWKVHPTIRVDGQDMRTEDVYRDPVLSALVSHEGPLRFTRYQAPVPSGGQQANVSSIRPRHAERGLQVWIEQALRKVV